MPEPTQHNQDDCGSCGVVYTFMPQDEKYRMYLFIEDPGCNCLMATCPSCGNVTRLFIFADTVISNILFGVKWSITARCTDELRHARATLFAEEEEAPATPEAPPVVPSNQEQFEEWLIETATDDELRHELGL